MLKKTEREIMQHWDNLDSKPLVSICCITYNQEKFIAETLDGFLMQETNFPFEIVIDDDASNDQTADIIRKYKKMFPSIIKEKLRIKNIGITQNYIENLHRAEGKYIALCEGDDYWIDPLKLQKQVDFLERNIEYGLICTDMIKYNQKEKKFYESNIVPLGQLSQNNNDEKDYVYEELIQWKSQIWTLTVCFRKELLKNLPKLDGTKYFLGDRLIFIHIALQSKIKYLEEKTAVYRILEESASHFTNPLKALEFHFKLANLTLYFIRNYPISTFKEKKIIYDCMFYKFQYALANNNYKERKEIKLPFPSSPSFKQIIVQILFYLSKNKIIFKILSRIYEKRIYAPYKT